MVRLWAISQHWTNIKGSDFILLEHYLILNVGLSIIYIVFNANFWTFHLHVDLHIIPAAASLLTSSLSRRLETPSSSGWTSSETAYTQGFTANGGKSSW